jgi:dUTPase
MMKKRISILLSIYLLLLFNNIAFAAFTGKHSDSFNEFKQLIENKYVFKNSKNVDWKALYSKHEYKITHSWNAKEFAKNLNDMILEIKDSHFYVVGYSSYRPEWLKRNYNINALPKIIGNLGSLRNLNDVVTVAKKDNIGYLMIKTWRKEETNNLKVLDGILEREFRTTNGLIIDIRMNGGGNSGNADILLKELNSEKYKKPIILLMGNYSASASEYFIISTDNIQNLITMGDQSRGMVGNPREFTLHNGVKVMMPRSTLNRSSGTKFVNSPDDTSYEDNPIQPDIAVSFIKDSSDNVLIAAFEKLGVKIDVPQTPHPSRKNRRSK